MYRSNRTDRTTSRVKPPAVDHHEHGNLPCGFPLGSFSVGSPPAQRSANATRPSLRYGPAGARRGHPADKNLRLRGNAVFSRVPRSLSVFLARSFSLRPRLSSHPFMDHLPAWSTHPYCKQQTVQCSNATVVHAAAWHVQRAERD